MAKPFLVTYPDRTQRHIGRSERDLLLLRNELRHVEGKSYEYTGQPRTFHNFVSLAQWQTQQTLNPEQLKRYLERLEVIKALELEREWEREETPEAFESRLRQMGMPPEGFSEAAA